MKKITSTKLIKTAIIFAFCVLTSIVLLTASYARNVFFIVILLFAKHTIFVQVKQNQKLPDRILSKITAISYLKSTVSHIAWYARLQNLDSITS